MMGKLTRLFFIVCFGITATTALGQSWSMKKANLMTPFSATIDTANVLGEYPRPQMVREQWMNLNGIWQFQSGTSITQPVPVGNLRGKILVPFPVESAISGVMVHYDKLWYRRSFTIPAGWSGQRILLHFGAVDYQSEVFINDQSLGIHKGGYDPFTYDITSKLTGNGPQILTVRVYDPTSSGGQPRGKQSLNPSGIMYTCSSGIWQSVWLEPVPQTSISEIKIVPDIDKAVLNLKVLTEGAAANQTVSVTIKDGANIVKTFDGAANTNLVIPISNPKLWSPKSPFLYDISITLKTDGADIDHLMSYFGMRKISVANVDGFMKMMLNNNFVFEMGPLDQGFWPDGLYTAPTDSALRFDIYKMKELGFNMVRKHIKVEPARWYYWADKLGLMVWQDMPSANSYILDTPPVDEVAYHDELIKMVKIHWNSPSIIMWVIFNEGQGQQNTETLVGEVMAMDTTRLVNQASGGNHAGVGHVLDIHSYPAPGCPASATQTLACGEYGGIGFSIPDHIWASGFGYVMVESADALADLYDVFSNDLLQFKTNNGLSAAVYTEITDVETELNGMTTYDRVVTKADAKKIFESNQKVINNYIYVTEVLPTAAIIPQLWNYTFEQPSADWYTTSYDDSQWRTGLSGFGTTNTPGAIVNTTWDTQDIWMRKQFFVGHLTPEIADSLVLILHHDEACEIYIIGVLASALTGYTTNYGMSSLSNAAKNALVANANNTIAIHCTQTTGGQYIDAGISIYSNSHKPDPLNIDKTEGLRVFVISPNPVNDKIQVSGYFNGKLSAEIFNSIGVKVFDIKNCSNTINVSNLTAGLYLLRLNNNSESFSYKFIKEK